MRVAGSVGRPDFRQPDAPFRRADDGFDPPARAPQQLDHQRGRRSATFWRAGVCGSMAGASQPALNRRRREPLSPGTDPSIAWSTSWAEFRSSTLAAVTVIPAVTARAPLAVWFAAAWHATSAKIWCLRQNPAGAPRLRFLPDGLEHAASLPRGAGATRPRSTRRSGRGQRDFHRRHPTREARARRRGRGARGGGRRTTRPQRFRSARPERHSRRAVTGRYARSCRTA